MQRHNDVPGQSGPEALPRPQGVRFLPRLPLLIASATLLLVMLACSLGRMGTRPGADVKLIRAPLPTLTPTSLPSLTPTALATPVAVAPAAGSIPPAELSSLAAGVDALGPAPLPSPFATPVQIDLAAPGQIASSVAPAAADPIATPPPSPTATATEPPPPTLTPTATATEAPTATATPTSTPVPPTATPLPQGWVFTGVRSHPQQEQGDLLLYGDVINNTGEAQTLGVITGNFYDAQGQLVSDARTIDYWPIEAVPAGARVPFAVTVYGLTDAGNFDLNVIAEPSLESPHEDFEFLELSQSNEGRDYCIAGKVRNLSEALRFYLSIVVVIYDEQDAVINFGDHYESYPKNLVGDQTMAFNVCVDPLDQAVTRYEVRAWGL